MKIVATAFSSGIIIDVCTIFNAPDNTRVLLFKLLKYSKLNILKLKASTQQNYLVNNIPARLK